MGFTGTYSHFWTLLKQNAQEIFMPLSLYNLIKNAWGVGGCFINAHKRLRNVEVGKDTQGLKLVANCTCTALCRTFTKNKWELWRIPRVTNLPNKPGVCWNGHGSPSDY